MARQPVQDLQGYGQTSVSSASPIDAYTGAPAIPQESQGSQLANALGAFSGGVARASARAAAKEKADKAEFDEKKAKAHAARFQGEEGEFLDSVKLGETYADLSETVVSTIVEDKYANEFYYSTFEKLNTLDDDVKGDVVALETMFDGLITEATTATEGMDFVQSGAVIGTRKAINEMRNRFSQFRDQKTRELAKTNTTANVFNILDKYDLSTSDGQTSSVTLINALNEKLIATSPFTKREDKQQIVDSLIEYTKLNPDSNAVGLIKRVPWLQSKETDAKLAVAAPAIAKLGMQKLRDDAYRKDIKDKQTLAEAQVQFNNLSLALDREGIRKAMVEANKLTGENAAVGAAMFKMGEVALAAAEVDADVSLKFAASYKGGLEVKALKGELNRNEVLEEIASSTDMREQEKESIRANLDSIMAGSDLIAASKHSTEYNNRVGDEARAIDQSILNLSGSLEGRSLESRVRDIWDNTVLDLIVEYATENNARPEGRALRAIYDEAEAIAEKRMEKLRGISTSNPQPDSEVEEAADLPVVTTQEEYDALPSGAQFLENGKLFTKP